MKRFKWLDAILGILLTLGFTTAAIIDPDRFFPAGLCFVWGWQLLSMLIHTASGWFINKGSDRRNYQQFVLVIIGIVLLSVLIPILRWPLFALPFATPLMAFYYILIYLYEIRVKMRRPLSLLK